MAGRTSRSAGADARPCSPADREPRDQTPRDAAHDPDADPESVARTITLGLLERQPRTRSELARALARRGVPDDVAVAVLDRFTEVGLIDDEAFAAAWVDSRHRGRGLGRRALSAELRRRGVDDTVARAAVEAVSAEDEEAAARALVARRLPSLSRVPVEARTRRLVGMLGRKGVSQGLALKVVREALAAETPPEGAAGVLVDP